MNKLISELILYSNIDEDSFLYKLCEIYADWNELQAWEASGVNAEDLEYPGADLTGELRGRLYKEIKHLLDVSTDYGFNGNLWQNYLTFFILSNENSFSVTCEGEGATDGGSINLLALHDFSIFKELFHFDFGPLEAALGTDCLSTVCHYQAIPKKDKLYNKDVSGIVTKVSENIARASTEQEIFDIVTAHYKSYGVGLFGINRAFRISGSGDGLQFVPISNASPVLLSDLVGYERQKKELMDNTAAFCQGLSANNVLLYGESGTGKSTSVKAIVNEFFDQGLRVIEIYKYQFVDLNLIISIIKKRNYKFIIFIDDLSFEETELEYKFLKAVIEGGVESRPDNVLIYATSNRRHLIRENWSDRDDMAHEGDMHVSETMEEKLSLSERFGIMINYPSPSKQQYNDIVLDLARKAGIDMDEEEILRGANRFEIRHGGLSGRVAEQYVKTLLPKS